jgi:tRNA (guanine6-N2)-methyltransferase
LPLSRAHTQARVLAKVPSQILLEAEVVEGLEALAAQEIPRKARIDTVPYPIKRGVLRFSYSGDLRDLLNLTLVQSLYVVVSFSVSRPKALLGHENFKRLCQQIESVLFLSSPHKTFTSISIGAAGADSSVMLRLKHELANVFKLQASDDKADLLLRIIPSREGVGWDCLIRLTPRPLATRSWRMENYEAALNATVARAMGLLAQVSDSGTVLNACCGSGSILVESAQEYTANTFIGCDYDASLLKMAEKNISAANIRQRVLLCNADVTQLSFSRNSFDAVLADLPFGHATGSHKENRILYPAFLDEAARVSKSSAKCVVLTHEIRLFESIVQSQRHWLLKQTMPITLRGIHPRIYVLTKS